MLDWLSERLGAKLAKKRCSLPGGGWFEVDGASESPSILCEAWAHLGPPKPAQKHKVMADAFKLLYASQLASRPVQMILLFADAEAARHFKGESWMAQALRANGIDVHVAELSEPVRATIRKAQTRQFR